MNLAATGDTWGIPGPAFLGLFALAFVAVLPVTFGLRWLAVRGRNPQREPHPYETAHLAGGRGQVIASAVAALYSARLVKAASGGELKLVAGPRAPLGPVDDAILTVLGRQKARAGSLLSWPAVERAVVELENGLIQAGLLVGPRERSRRRWAALPLGLLTAVGVARVVAGSANGKPVTFVILVTIIAALVWLVMAIRSPRLTSAGRGALRAVRARNRVLNPAMSPAWVTYGPTGAALGVALFGGAALISMDASFARATELQYVGLSTASSGFSGGGSSSSSCSSSSSSSCSGSSSCSSSSCGGGGCGG